MLDRARRNEGDPIPLGLPEDTLKAFRIEVALFTSFFFQPAAATAAAAAASTTMEGELRGT